MTRSLVAELELETKAGLGESMDKIGGMHEWHLVVHQKY